MRVVVAVFAFLLLATSAMAETVSVQDGNIFVGTRQITGGGHDSDPVLAPDGRHVVFARIGPPSPQTAKCAPDGRGPVPSISLWIADDSGAHVARLLDGHAADRPADAICAFNHKSFDSSGRRLYFDTPAWATSGATHVIDLGTGQQRLFLAGDLLKVLSTCSDDQYRDDVIVRQHRYFVFGGSYDWYWLFSPDGQELGPLGENAAMAADPCK